MPIRLHHFSPGYFQETAAIWLLLSAADTAFFGFTAIALPALAAVCADLGAAALALLLPASLRRLLPLAVLSDKDLWKTEAFPGTLYAAAAAAGALLLLSVAGAWLVFRKKDLP